jgi:hypothetical protein
MSEDERQQALETYNPRKHLIKIKARDGSLKDYYPAAWRLYELNLRHQDANFTSEIVFLDCERDLVVVKCRLFLGPDFEASPRKTEALKSGKLSQLDKVETAAKARCARDIGIGTEYALDVDDSIDAAQLASVKPLTLGYIKNAVKKAGKASDPQSWQKYMAETLGTLVAEKDLTPEQLQKLLDAAQPAETPRSA